MQGEQLVKGQAKAVNVAAGIGVAGELLRRHVTQRAHHGPGLGHVVVLHRLGQPEIGDPGHALRVQEQIGRFDVAVQRMMGMGVLQCLGHLLADRGNAPPIRRSELPRFNTRRAVRQVLGSPPGGRR